MGYIVPKPDILILCDGDAKVIWERKREVTFEDHMKYKNQLLESFLKSKVEKYIINTDFFDANQCYEQIINCIRNSNTRRNLLYRDSEYILTRKDLFNNVTRFLNIDSNKGNLIRIKFKFYQTIKQTINLTKLLLNKNRNPYYVIEDCEGIYSGIISLSSSRWLRYVFYRCIRVFVRGFINHKIDEGLFLVGKVQNWSELENELEISGKEHNGTLTIIKESVVSKLYLRNIGLYRNNRMDALVNIQRKASKLLSERKSNLNVPDILNVFIGEKFYEVTFKKVFKASGKCKIDLQSALNDVNMLSEALDQCTTEIERKELALDDYINSVIMCIKNDNLKARLIIESKEWINELYNGKHEIQISHGDCWIGNYIEDENSMWVIDFDRMAVLPKWYDIVHYIIQLSSLACKGLNRWFDKIIKSEDIEEVLINFLNKQKSDSALAITQFVRENNIPYEELLFAEIWVYRLIAIYMAQMDRKGAGDEVEIIKFIEIINKIYSSKKGFIYKILKLDF